MRRDVHQAEGCEQGDPLAPALFALGQHGALARAAGDLDPTDKLLAFLDDLYVITVAARARPALDTVTGAVEEHCGIASNLGKTRGLGGSEGSAPPGLAELGPDVWRGDRPSHERGMVVLGSPVGHTDFVHAWAVHRLLEEQQLLQQLPQLPDLQCSWLLLALCASPRANHALRTVPPTVIASYAAGHDDAIWHTLLDCLGGEAGAPPEDAHLARATAFLPAALGGLGLQSATRSAPAAYWAAWADALLVMGARLPVFAAHCVETLQRGGAEMACLRHAADARTLLLTEGWEACPTWQDVAGNQRPEPAAEPQLGDWPHGWQQHASRTRNLYFRDRVLLPSLPPARRAVLRSQSGLHGGAWLSAIPGDAMTTLPPCAAGCGCRYSLPLASAAPRRDAEDK